KPVRRRASSCFCPPWASSLRDCSSSDLWPQSASRCSADPERELPTPVSMRMTVAIIRFGPRQSFSILLRSLQAQRRRNDYRSSSQQFPFAAHSLASGGTWCRLRNQGLSARDATTNLAPESLKKVH